MFVVVKKSPKDSRSVRVVLKKIFKFWIKGEKWLTLYHSFMEMELGLQ